MSTTSKPDLEMMYESTLKRVQALEYLVNLSQNLTESLDVDEVLWRIANGVMTILNAFGCVIFLLEKDGKTLTPRVVIDPEFKDEILATSISVENSLTGKAIIARQGLIFNNTVTIKDAYQIPGTTEDEDESVLSVPLIVDDVVLGAMTVNRMVDDFNDNDLWLAEAFGRYAAIALKNAQVYQALQTSKERFHQLFENMNSGVAVYEAIDDGDDFIITNFNAAGERIGKVDRKDIIGKKVTDVFPEVKNHGLLDVIQRVWQTGTSEKFLLTYYKNDKLLRWRNNYIYKLPAGEIVAVYDDVTTQKQAEIALKESEERFRTLFDDAPVAVWTFDRDGKILSWNKASEQIYGWSAEEAVGKTMFDLMVRPENVVRTQEGITAVFQGKEVINQEFEDLCADGSHVILLSNEYPLRNAAGQVIEGICAEIDITERKAMERKLAQTTRSLLNAQAIAHIGNWDWNIITNELMWSDEVYRIFGLEPQSLDASYSIFLEMVHPDDRQTVIDAVDTTFANQKIPYHIQHRVVRPNGDIRWVEEIGDLQRDAHGNPVLMIGSVQDITERKIAETALQESESRLQQAQKMESIGTLAGGIAHDFNNLLTAINGQAELGLMKLPKDHSVRKNLDGILDAGKRAAKLTGQLLAFSRRQIRRPQLVDINKNVLDLQDMLRHLIRENIKIETKLTPNLPFINADPHQLEQILINLVVNARDAIYEQPDSSQEKVITIKTDKIELNKAFSDTHPDSSPGSYICFCVSDTGIGMDESVRQKIFEPFYTTKPKGRGTGLGLATVYGIVKQNNGNIYVYSEKGRGTTIKILWTIAEDNVVPSLQQTAKDVLTLHGMETILLVEDDAQVRAFAADSLRALGYTLWVAENGVHALQLLAKNSISVLSLLVTDIIMPEMDGTKLAETLRQQIPNLPILFMSGYTDDLLGRQGVLQKPIEFLQKPFSTYELAQKVRATLDNVE